ncbi:flagellar hook-length control protein FliK [bacterium]|nr:flagellar hook-length control protein FliK [bacterium]
MDLSTLMMSQNIAMMPQAGSVDVVQPQGQGGSKEFGNLLSLVEGMETAEMSMGSDEALENLLKEVEMPGQANLDGQKILAQANLGGEMIAASMKQGTNLANETPVEMINQMDVGQSALLGKQTEILSGNGVLSPSPSMGIGLDGLEAYSRENLAALSLAQKQGQRSEKMNLESVAAWSQGLASKEIQSVSVEGSADPVVGQKLQAQENLQLKDLGERVLDSKAPGAGSEIVSAKGLSSAAAALPAGLRDEKLEGFAQAKPEVVSMPKVEAGSNELSQSSDLKPEQKVASKSEAKNESSDQAMLAKDFMLGQIATSKASGANSASTVDTSKISKEVADFVSEKVDQLQNSGQETLRVKMESKDLGGLDIKVTLKRGLVDVDIRAVRPESQAILDSSKSQLQDKLAKVVDLGALDVGVNFKAMNQAKISSDSAAASLSHDMLRSMSKVDGGEARVFSQSLNQVNTQHSHLSEVASAEQSQNMGQSKEFARDEKREQAMTQWQQFINLRQSA